MAQIALENPGALVFLLAGWLLLVLFAWRRRFRPFGPFLMRLVIVVLLALALASPVYIPPSVAVAVEPPERIVLLVDQSASLGAAGQQALRSEAARLTQLSPDTVTVFFAGDTVGVPPGTPLDAVTLDETVTNLAKALEAGAGLLHGEAGRLILLTDGFETDGDAVGTAARLAHADIAVEIIQVPAFNAPGEVRLVSLNVPPSLRAGETVNLEVVIHSTVFTDVTLRLTQNAEGLVLAEDVIPVEAGLNLFTFDTTLTQMGPHTFRAHVAAPGDIEPSNNTYAAFTQVYPPPEILAVGNGNISYQLFIQQLSNEGFNVTPMRPESLPSRLSELDRFAGMVLHNVSARSLELEQMLAIQEFVRSLGRGVLVTGGRDSLSLGNYADTPLAEILPLDLEPPPREERPPVTLLLIMDHSGSMVENRAPATKLAMAKEAAIRATDILGPEDFIGVLMFDNRVQWVVPFQQVSDGAELLAVQERISQIPGGGGTRILQALETGLPALAEQQSASAARHAVLLTDGKSFDNGLGIDAYNRVVDAALDVGITLSTIAIGYGADEALMAYLADRGRGRYHFAPIPDELPALTIEESAILRSNAIQEEEDYVPVVAAPHPMLRSLCFTPDCGQPILQGYLAMTPKPWAEIPLETGPGDPLLGVWGYGLGRVVVWTTDTGEEWAASWQLWGQAPQFWGQVLDYTLPAPELGLLQVQTDLAPDDTLTITADGVTATGQTVDLTRTEANLVTPGGRSVPLTLRQISPGRYQQRLRLSDVGAYQLTVIQSRDSEGTSIPAVATTGFVKPYAAEYGLLDQSLGTTLLRDIAALTGGQIFQPGERAIPPPEVAAEIPEAAPIYAWPWLLGLALLLWPLEIAWRRWTRLRIQ